MILLPGSIYKSDYINFIDLFRQAFPDGGSGVAIASRLLAMKRPDQFVCLDKRNRPKLCNELGISKTVSFESYWDDVIERIKDSVWWSSEIPSNKTEAKAWLGRAAMLEGDPGALKRANAKSAKVEASYGNPLALYNYANANGGLFVK